MSEIEITKESDTLICVLYKEYLQRRKNGVPKSKAVSFGDSSSVKTLLLPKWNTADIDEACHELDDAGLLHCFFADCEASEISISNTGIVYMEQRFSKNISSVFNYLEKLRSILPW